MRYAIVFIITCAVMLTSLFAAGREEAIAADGEVLQKDTTLPILLNRAGITFAGGTKVYYNDQNQVRKGTLAQATSLGVPGSDSPVPFAGRSQVEFSMSGLVQQGIMVNDTLLTVDGGKRSMRFRGGLPIYFGAGGVSAGTLAESASLPNPKNKNREEVFPAGTYVMFTITGQVYLIQPRK